MSLLRLFTGRASIHKGLEEYQNTPGAVLLDVRTPAEYAQGHIPGSVNRPLDQMASISQDKRTPLFVYCYSGARSGQACSWLRANGYQATNIGGISGYRGPME